MALKRSEMFTYLIDGPLRQIKSTQKLILDRKALFLIFTIFLLSMSVSGQNSNIMNYTDFINSTDLGKGTLIVIVPTKKGIVICSDKRIYSPSKGDSDTITKIKKTGKSSAFAVVGAPIVWHSGRKIFDVFEILNNSLYGNEIIDSEETWHKIQNNLKNSFKNNVLSLDYKDWPESQYPQKENVFFEIIFFHYDSKGIPTMSLIQFTYLKQPNPFVKTQVYSLSAKGSFTAFGSGHVIMELQSGDDKRFDKYRNNSRLNKFLTNSVQPNDVSISSARYFAKKMIRISNEKYSLVTNIDGHISPKSDCAILHNKKGFIWLK